MTIIVKPRTPETSDDVIADYLTDLLGTLSFPSFEAAEMGEITLLGTKFCMRVGKFLGQHTQAIMAKGQFVKMQHISSNYDKSYLKVIDPKDPDSSLYDIGYSTNTQFRSWRPPPPSPPTAPGGLLQQGGQGNIGVAQNPYWNSRPASSPAQQIAAMKHAQMEMAIEADKLKAAQNSIPQIYGTWLPEKTWLPENKSGFWKRVFGGE